MYQLLTTKLGPVCTGKGSHTNYLYYQKRCSLHPMTAYLLTGDELQEMLVLANTVALNSLLKIRKYWFRADDDSR